jgi:hypothetical protein
MKKWDPQRMNAAIEVMRNKEMAATRHPVFSDYH